MSTTNPKNPVTLMRRAGAPLLLALAALLGGCASVAPVSQLPALQARHHTRLPAAPAAASTRAARAWWQELQDPLLDRLLVQAQTRNLDLKAALASVQEAHSLAGLARREGLPQGGLDLSAQVSRPSRPEVDPYSQGQPRVPEQRLVGLSQSLSWELDLFGRVGTAQAVAERELDLAQADLHGAHALLQAELVQRYTQLRAAQQGDLLAGQQLALAQTKLAQLEARSAAGLADAREQRAAEAELAQRRAANGAMAAQIRQQLAAIALLCGEAPAALDAGGSLAGLREPQALPALPEQQSLQVPEDLLQRLPQVARADAALRASLGQQVLAERAHLPRLSLAATIGLNEDASRLGKSGALRYAAGPALQWDWLDAGRRQAREAAAKAGSERAWAQFEQSVLQALADGESALRGWQARYLGWQEAQQALRAAAEAARYAAQRQALGLEPPLSAIGSESQRLAAEQTNTEQQALALQAYVQVQLALGAWRP